MDNHSEGVFPNDGDWAEHILRDALRSDAASNLTDFNREYEAMVDGVKQREGRAIVVAAAALALGTQALKSCSENYHEPTAEEIGGLAEALDRLEDLLPSNVVTYLPVFIAS